MSERSWVEHTGVVVAMTTVFGSFGLLYFLMNRGVFLICIGVGVAVAACSLTTVAALSRTDHREEMWLLGFFYLVAGVRFGGSLTVR